MRPSRNVIAFLRSHGKVSVFRLQFPGYNDQVGWPGITQNDSRADRNRIGDAEPRSLWNVFMRKHVLNLKAIVRGEDAEIKLRAELIEAVTAEVVSRGKSKV